MQTQLVPFWLNRVSVLPANESELLLEDILANSAGWQRIVLCNYMIDMAWLFQVCRQALKKAKEILILSGESSNEHIVEAARVNGAERKVRVMSPPLPLPFGTHHSKCILCIGAKGIRVVVCTANFICDDWTRKTQGIYCQDFPRRSATSSSSVTANDFGEVLVDYFHRCGVDMTELLEFDYSAAAVDLVPSVPGYHRGLDLEKFGQGRLRSLLRKVHPSTSVHLSWQYSSQGSLTDSFLSDLQRTMLGADTHLLPQTQVTIHMPTEEQVRQSIEGWRGGSSIPIYLKNCHEFVNARLHKWGLQSDHPRRLAMPHIKSYARYATAEGGGGCLLDWFLLTSANLSRAAFGEFQKKGEQLQIRSYELGVLYHPQRLAAWTDSQRTFNCATDMPIAAVAKSLSTSVHMFRSISSCGPSSSKAGTVTRFALCLPYSIAHPVPYESTVQLSTGKHRGPVSRTDVPWVCDVHHRGIDSLGCSIETLEAYSHYGETSWKAPTLHFETWKRDVVDVDATSSADEASQSSVRSRKRTRPEL